MERGGIAKKLVDVAEMLTGTMPGGLGMAAIVASMFFAAISGSGPATAAAIGGIMIGAMTAQGYSKGYSGALIAAGSTIGPVIPPSIPMIMYRRKADLKDCFWNPEQGTGQSLSRNQSFQNS